MQTPEERARQSSSDEFRRAQADLRQPPPERGAQPKLAPQTTVQSQPMRLANAGIPSGSDGGGAGGGTLLLCVVVSNGVAYTTSVVTDGSLTPL